MFTELLKGAGTFVAIKGAKQASNTLGKGAAKLVDGTIFVSKNDVGYTNPTYFSQGASFVLSAGAFATGKLLGDLVAPYLGGYGLGGHALGMFAGSYCSDRLEVRARKFQHDKLKFIFGEDAPKSAANDANSVAITPQFARAASMSRRADALDLAVDSRLMPKASSVRP